MRAGNRVVIFIGKHDVAYESGTVDRGDPKLPCADELGVILFDRGGVDEYVRINAYIVCGLSVDNLDPLIFESLCNVRLGAVGTADFEALLIE